MKILPSGIAVIEGDTHASKEVERQGKLIYESWAYDMQKYIKPGDVCVDVGAMIGCYSRAMKDAVGPTGFVLSFEPNKEAFECLQHNCPDCKCFNHGLSSHWRPYNRQADSHGNAGGTWYLPSEDGEMFEPLGWIGSCDLIKVDVEGMELEVIQGAHKVIEQHKPVLWVEVNEVTLKRQGHTAADLFKEIESHGYLWKIVQEGATIDSPQFDVVCTVK